MSCLPSVETAAPGRTRKTQKEGNRAEPVSRGTMIRLTRLGGEAFVLNAELIRYVEARPDTFITLIGGDRIVVVESMDEVLRRAVAYQQAKHLIPPPARAHRRAESAGQTVEES